VSTGRCLTSDGHQLYVKPAGEADDDEDAAGAVVAEEARSA
jgi:hypothetical protein